MKKLDWTCSVPFFPLLELKQSFFFWFRASSEYVVIGHNLYRSLPLKKCLCSLLMMGVAAQQCVRVIHYSSKQIKKIIEECTGTFLFSKSEIEGAKSLGDRSYIIWWCYADLCLLRVCLQQKLEVMRRDWMRERPSRKNSSNLSFLKGPS